MEATKYKLKTFSKIVGVLARIGSIVCILGIVCCVAIAIFLLSDPNALTTYAESAFTFQGPSSGTLTNLADASSQIAFAFTATIFSLVICLKLEKLFCNMRDEETPFTLENANIFKSMAITMIVGAVVPQIVGIAVGQTIAVRNPGMAFSVNYDIGFSVFAVLICFVMSVIFKYGCELQTQVDETL